MWHTISIEKRTQIPFYKLDNWYYNDSMWITHNLAPIIYDAIEWIGRKDDIESFWAWLNGRQCCDAFVTLQDMLEYIIKNKKKYLKMQPENWYWTYEWLVDCLQQLCKACKDFPEYYITDWY